MKNYFAPVAIVVFEIGLARSDKIARDPAARANCPKIVYPGQRSFIAAQGPACKLLTAIAKTSQQWRATVAAIGDIDAVFIGNRRSCGCKHVTESQ